MRAAIYSRRTLSRSFVDLQQDRSLVAMWQKISRTYSESSSIDCCGTFHHLPSMDRCACVLFLCVGRTIVIVVGSQTTWQRPTAYHRAYHTAYHTAYAYGVCIRRIIGRIIRRIIRRMHTRYAVWYGVCWGVYSSIFQVNITINITEFCMAHHTACYTAKIWNILQQIQQIIVTCLPKKNTPWQAGSFPRNVTRH